MGKSTRKLKPEDLHALKWMIGASMGLVAALSLFNLSGHNLLPARFVTAAIGVCMLFPRLYAKLPPSAWKIYAVGILPLLMVDIFARETVPALLNLNTWLILYRALNHDTRREEMQLSLLCLFLLIMVGILSSTFLFGIQLFLFAGFALAFLVAGSALENATEQKNLPGRSQAWMAQFSWMRFFRATSFRTVFLMGSLFSALLMVASICFLIIPRIDVDNKVNLFEMEGAGSLTGFSENITLGEVTDIKNDNSVALRVDVANAQVMPDDLYWRMLALDEYRNGSFSLSTELKSVMFSDFGLPYRAVAYWPEVSFSAAPSVGGRERLTFYLEPGISKFLPLAGSFRGLAAGNLKDIRIGPQMHLVGMQETNSKLITYQLEGLDFTGEIVEPAFGMPTVAGGRGIDLAGRNERTVYPDTLLGVPEDESELKFLMMAVDEIRRGETLSPKAFASRAMAYLWKRHDYSMSVSLPKDGPEIDPVIRWMQSDLPGHCEFFASSMVLLARTAGYPARAVIGYKGGTWNDYEKYFMVRNADAHAWCEIGDGAGRWYRVDPTPGSPLPTDRPSMSILAELPGETGSLAYIDSLRMLWYRRIVSFDQDAQQEAAGQARQFILAYLGVAKEWGLIAWAAVKDWAMAPWNWPRILTVLGVLGLATGLYWLQRRMALTVREMIAALFRGGDPIRRKASKLLRKAEARGARRIPKVGTSAWDAMLADLMRLRYGSKASWPNPGRVFRRARRLI